MRYKECENCVANKWCTLKDKPRSREDKTWCDIEVRLSSAVELSQLPKRYTKANLYMYRDDLKQTEVYKFTSKVVKYLDMLIDEGRSILFWGKVPGTGKTYNASTILNHFIYKKCGGPEFDFEHPIGLYVVYAELMDNLRYRKNEPEVQQLLENVLNAPLLVIDDIASGTNTAFTREQTYLIINKRVNEGKATIYTSNLSLPELSSPDVLGARTVSRIMTDSTVVEVKGADNRIQGLGGVK